jgi:hypothetical protein
MELLAGQIWDTFMPKVSMSVLTSSVREVEYMHFSVEVALRKRVGNDSYVYVKVFMWCFIRHCTN